MIISGGVGGSLGRCAVPQATRHNSGSAEQLLGVITWRSQKTVIVGLQIARISREGVAEAAPPLVASNLAREHCQEKCSRFGMMQSIRQEP